MILYDIFDTSTSTLDFPASIHSFLVHIVLLLLVLVFPDCSNTWKLYKYHSFEPTSVCIYHAHPQTRRVE